MSRSDWLWGLGLGVGALAVLGITFLLPIAAGSTDPCGQPLAPLGTSEVSAEAFANEDLALEQVVQALNRGERQVAEAQFYGPIHGFTHNVDPPVRERDEPLAKRPCQAVINVEGGLANRISDIELAADILDLHDVLRETAVALGYPDSDEGT